LVFLSDFFFFSLRRCGFFFFRGFCGGGGGDRMVSQDKAADGGDRTENNCDCQIFQQVFTGVPVHISNTFSREPPHFQTNCQTNFRVSKQSPQHSKDLSGKLIDLEIQIYYKSDLLFERTQSRQRLS